MIMNILSKSILRRSQFEHDSQYTILLKGFIYPGYLKRVVYWISCYCWLLFI